MRVLEWGGQANFLMSYAEDFSPLDRTRPLIESLFRVMEVGSGLTFDLVSSRGQSLLDLELEGEAPIFLIRMSPIHQCWLKIYGEHPHLTALAGHAARALEQVFQRHCEQQLQTETIGQLYEVATTLNQTIQLDELLEKILTFARALSKAASGSLVMLDQVHSELKMLQQNGKEATTVTTTRVLPGRDLEDWLMHEGQIRRTLAGALTPGVLGVPLRSRQRIVGSLTLVGAPRGDFAEADLQALMILAGHAAHAIHNAQLYGQVERQLSELQALQQMSESLNRTVVMDEVLSQLLDDTLHLLHAENASVMLLEPDQETLTIRMARGLTEEVISQTRVKLGERISGKVAQQRKPILCSAFETEEAGSALCVPLLKDEEVLGVLNVRHKKGGGDFSLDELSLAARFANVAALSISKAGLHNELRQLFVHSIRALANAIDARDPCTSGHSERVTRYSVMIAERMGFRGDALEELRYAALLHDIGKIRIRDHILHKPGRLTEEEFEEMKRHPEYGVEIMQPVRAFQSILPYMLHHHERFDGGGYPAGLEGLRIPVQARIMCVADCFDAMTSDRPYRLAMPVEDAAAELRRNRGQQFDPEATDHFLNLILEGKVQDIVEPRIQTS